MRRHLYEIRVVGVLGSSWTDWFDGLSIHHEQDESGGQTFSVFTGSMDQAALHGVLATIRDINATLISVRPADDVTQIRSNSAADAANESPIDDSGGARAD